MASGEGRVASGEWRVATAGVTLFIVIGAAGMLPDEESMNLADLSHHAAAIPGSHRDLIAGPYPAALSTVMPDGQPQSTVVWCNTDGPHVLLNTMIGFRKEKNMRRNPKVTLFCFDRSPKLTQIYTGVD